MSERVLVLGATGTVGSAVVERLAGVVPVRALTRDPSRLPQLERSGVEPVLGNLAWPETLVPAFANVDRVFLACGHHARQGELERNAIDAAVAAGVRHVVKLSGGTAGVAPSSPSPIGRAHWETERYLARSGIDASIMRPGPFMQNLLALAPLIARTGVLPAPLGDMRAAMIDARDVAAVGATLLTREPDKRILELTGPQALRLADVATILTRVSGSPVVYLNIPPGIAERALKLSRPPRWLLDHEVAALQIGQSGGAGRVTDSVRALLGHPPTPFAAFAAEHAERIRRPAGPLSPLYAVNRALVPRALALVKPRPAGHRAAVPGGRVREPSMTHASP